MSAKISIIAAMAENRVIGKDNAMLWHISADFKHFKNTTMGKPMIMGRKTFESLPGILPGRPHIIVSRSGFEKDGVTSCESLEAAIEIARNMGDTDEIFIIGGGQIYAQALENNLADRIYLTLVHADYKGDTSFPVFDWDKWDVTDEEQHAGEPDFTFLTLERVQE